MIRTMVLPLRALLGALAAHDTPRGFAWGVTLGMCWGLIPKDNLASAAIVVVLLATHANASAAAASAVVFSWIGAWCDPLTHRLGYALLTAPAFEPFWTWLYNLPFSRWTAFNNTVVLGNLVVSACLADPMYRIAKAAHTRYRSRAAERLNRLRAALVLKLADIATARSWR